MSESLREVQEHLQAIRARADRPSGLMYRSVPLAELSREDLETILVEKTMQQNHQLRSMGHEVP